MKSQDHQYYSEELERFANLIYFDDYAVGGLHALALNLDNAMAKVRYMPQRLALEKTHGMVRDAYVCVCEGDDDAASDMLGVAQYWLARAA